MFVIAFRHIFFFDLDVTLDYKTKKKITPKNI